MHNLIRYTLFLSLFTSMVNAQGMSTLRGAEFGAILTVISLMQTNIKALSDANLTLQPAFKTSSHKAPKQNGPSNEKREIRRTHAQPRTLRY